MHDPVGQSDLRYDDLIDLRRFHDAGIDPRRRNDYVGTIRIQPHSSIRSSMVCTFNSSYNARSRS